MLSRGYTLMVKLHNAKRTHKLAQSVETWVSDEKVPERQIGWVTQPTPYVLPTRQLAIRHRKRGAKHTDEFGYSVLVFNLSDATLAELLDLNAPGAPLSPQAMFNALHFYDLRGGALETQFKGDKQGLGLAHRNKRRFYAQEMLVLLGQLAHTLSSGHAIVWPRPIRISSTLAFGAWCGMSFGLRAPSVLIPRASSCMWHSIPDIPVPPLSCALLDRIMYDL